MLPAVSLYQQLFLIPSMKASRSCDTSLIISGKEYQTGSRGKKYSIAGLVPTKPDLFLTAEEHASQNKLSPYLMYSFPLRFIA